MKKLSRLLLPMALMATSAQQSDFNIKYVGNEKYLTAGTHNSTNLTSKQRKLRKNKRRISGKMRAYNHINK